MQKSGNKTDLEWNFESDDTQVNSFEKLVGLIILLYVIPNLNSKLGDAEKKFIEACFQEFGYDDKSYEWDKTIAKHKEIRNLCLCTNVYNRASDESRKTPLKKLSNVIKNNNFTWNNLFNMIKSLDSYCFIWFRSNFFDEKNFDNVDEIEELEKKTIKSELKNFSKEYYVDRRNTIKKRRKDWIEQQNLGEKRVIKSKEDLGDILSKIKKCSEVPLLLYSNELKIFEYMTTNYSSMYLYNFLLKFKMPEYNIDYNEYNRIEDRKVILKLLTDLGFSFDYEKFIGRKNNYDYTMVYYSDISKSKRINNFESLVKSYNECCNLDKSMLWFDDKNKKIDYSMLGFESNWKDGFCSVDKQYNRGFSEEDMSCVLDKFKNEERGFCHEQNIGFFVYMMKRPVEDKVRIMKDEKKREQFYLDLMDVIAKSVSVDSISINKLFNCKERDFTKQEEEDFIKKNNLQGIEEKTISTLTFMGYTEKGDKLYLKNEKNQKLLLNKIEYAGYFWDIITRIPKDVLNKKEIQKKIKEALDNMYHKFGVGTEPQAQVISLTLYVYENYDLGLNKADIEKLRERVLSFCRLYNARKSFWTDNMFRIIFKNRDKFSLNEKKKLLGEVMNTKIKSFGWSFSEEEKELKDSKSKLNQKIQKIQRKFISYQLKKLSVEERISFLSKRKLEFQKEKLTSIVNNKTNAKNKIEQTIKSNKLRDYLEIAEKIKISEKASKIQLAVKRFLKLKMTKICRRLFIGFVFSLVIFLFEMFVFDVAFLSVPSILTLLVAIILTARFLYIDHKFKIFFWKHKPPMKIITNSSIERQNLIFAHQNSINNFIDMSINNQNSNLKPIGEENMSNTCKTNQN